MNAATWQIGSLAVSFTGDLSPFAGILSRPPATNSGAAPIRVDIALCNQVEWPIGIETAPERYRKGLPSHETRLDFSARQLSFRIVSPLTETTSYLLHRDLFCGLGGLAGDPLLHASAVVRDGAVHAFLAVSGGGKSTIAKLLRPHAGWLNDEIIWVTDLNGVPQVINQAYWRGEDSCGSEPLLPLAALYLIDQATSCKRTPMAPTDLYAMALGAPFGPEDPQLPARATATAKLLEATPCYHLTVPLDGNAIAKEIFVF